jgi:hypothetical protein
MYSIKHRNIRPHRTFRIVGGMTALIAALLSAVVRAGLRLGN